MMQSVGEHEEVLKEEAIVRSSGALKTQHGPESGSRTPPEAERKDLGEFWIQED
jgi:hypothetical protein